MPPKKNSMSAAATEELIAQRVANALADYEANQKSGNENDNRNGSHNSGSDAHWFKKMEYVFNISNCTVECHVKYATCTLLGGTLTWWNSHVRTVGHDAAYGMPWKTLMKIMTETYYPKSEIKNLETELWKSFSMLCSRDMYDVGCDKVDGERQADNKRRIDNNPGDNHAQQPPYKRQNVTRAYTAGPSEKKEYVGTLPLCNKCKLHHNGPCTIKCTNCKRVGHLTRDCKSPTAVGNQRTLTCFECGNQRYYRSECPRLKNQNCGNQTGNGEANGRVYALRGGETDQDPNNIVDDIDA
ncbi:RNA-directed DNA polymerase, eukaryota [Tanacetum coccineum]